MNYRIIAYTLGWVLNIEGACLLLPLLCSLIYSESCTMSYVVSILLCIAVGIPLTVKKPSNKTMYSKEGLVTVALSWVVLSLFGCLPFIVSGFVPNFFDALFETVSGFTTTGATILKSVDALPKSLIFWRSFTHWIGGMGVLVFLVALLPLSGGNNMHLIRAESTGPSVSKIVPKVKSTAKLLYGIYMALTVIETVLLLMGGLTFFEAVTTSLGTMGTGGFGISDAGIMAESSYVQYVVAIFMLIAGVDFSIYYLILVRHMGKALFTDEFKTYMGIITVGTLLIFTNLALTCKEAFGTFEEIFRHSFFQVVSIITTTGYATTDFNLWPTFSKIVLVLIMFSGGCAGSTAGGIKVSRLIILAKSLAKEIKLAAHPRITHRISMNGRTIEHETVRSVTMFIVAYAFIMATALLIVSLDGFDFTTTFTGVLTTLGNVGPGLEKVGPLGNFGDFSGLSKLVFCFNMLIGRLEIFPMLVLLTPRIIRK